MNWHLAFYSWPHPQPATETVQRSDQTVQRWLLGDQRPEPFPVTLEQALSGLETEFNAYTEGDGSFGFSSQEFGGDVWKVSGTLFEIANEVGCADVWWDGAPAGHLTRFLSTLNAGPDTAVVQWLDEGIYLSVHAMTDWLPSPPE